MNDITVTFEDPVQQALFTQFNGRNLFLFAADQTGNLILPVERFSGVPAQYLLHVVNVKALRVIAQNALGHGIGNDPNSYRLDNGDATFTLTIDGTTSIQVTLAASDTLINANADDLVADLNATGKALKNALAAAGLAADLIVAGHTADDQLYFSLNRPGTLTIQGSNVAFRELGFVNGQDNTGPAEEMGFYKIQINAQVGTTTNVGPTDATARIDSQILGEQAGAIPLGDINHDGFQDFVAIIRDNTGNVSSIPAGFSSHPADLLGDPAQSSFVRIYFGSANPANQTFTDATSFTLRLPAPVQNASVFAPRCHRNRHRCCRRATTTVTVSMTSRWL